MKKIRTMKNKNNSKENSYKFKAKYKKLLNEKGNKKKAKNISFI